MCVVFYIVMNLSENIFLLVLYMGYKIFGKHNADLYERHNCFCLVEIVSSFMNVYLYFIYYYFLVLFVLRHAVPHAQILSAVLPGRKIEF